MIQILFRGKLTLISEDTNVQIIEERDKIFAYFPNKEYMIIGEPNTYNMETTPKQVRDLIQESIMRDEYNIEIVMEGKKYILKK